jgi:hypothetical protein
MERTYCMYGLTHSRSQGSPSSEQKWGVGGGVGGGFYCYEHFILRALRGHMRSATWRAGNDFPRLCAP